MTKDEIKEIKELNIKADNIISSTLFKKENESVLLKKAISLLADYMQTLNYLTAK